MTRPLPAADDVADDRRRERVRARLRPLADRTQQSAWAVPPAPGLDPRWVLAILASATAPGDRVRVYQPCAACLAQARWTPSGLSPLAWPRLHVVTGSGENGPRAANEARGKEGPACQPD